MYKIDGIFLIILGILLGLPMVYWGSSITLMFSNSTDAPITVTRTIQSFPYELVYSALGAVAVVALAWQRIADARNARLNALIKRAWNTDTVREVEAIKDSVDRHKPFNISKVEESLSVLKKYGRIYKIDQICPEDALKELEQLVSLADKYLKALKEFDEAIRKKDVGRAKEFVLGRMELRHHGGDAFEWVVEPDGKRLPTGSIVTRTYHDILVDLKKNLDNSEYLVKHRQGFWQKELSERASRVRDRFRQLAEERSLA